MRTHGARSLIPAVLLSLLCAAAASCVPRGLFRLWHRGGVYMILAVRARGPALEQSIRQTAQVIETRCAHLGVRCEVEPQGREEPNLVRLNVSGARDLARVKAVLLAEGRLELRPVVSPPSPMPVQTYPTREAAAAAAARSDYEVVPYEDRGADAGFLTVEREPVVTGADLRDASAVPDIGIPGAEYKINFTLKPEGAYRFGEWTGANINRYLAIVLNGKARSVTYVRSRITDTGQINGDFTREQAQDIALTLRSGSLPAPVEVLEEGTY